MAIVVDRIIPDVMYSLFRWLRSYQYTVGIVTGPLTTHFAGLDVIPAYPDDLVNLARPTLAIGGPADASQTMAFISDASREDTYTVRLYGFVVGQGSDVRNRLYRDKLMNDVFELMKIAEDEGIPLYDSVTELVTGGEMEMAGASIRQLPANALEIEAERYKFTAEADVPID